jgi:hypothetical protein
MPRALEPDPSLPLVLVGEIVEAAFEGQGGARVNLVVAHKWPRLRARQAVPASAGSKPIPAVPEVVWSKTLYKATLLGETRASFVAYLTKPAALIGRKIVLAGVPIGGFDMQDEHYIQVFHAQAFLPSAAWLASYEATSEMPIAKKA